LEVRILKQEEMETLLNLHKQDIIISQYLRNFMTLLMYLSMKS